MDFRSVKMSTGSYVNIYSDTSDWICLEHYMAIGLDADDFFYQCDAERGDIPLVDFFECAIYNLHSEIGYDIERVWPISVRNAVRKTKKQLGVSN